MTDLPTPLSRHRDGLPDWCESIVERALAKSPADRFQTASEFRSALKHITSRAPERTYRLSPSEYGRLGLASAQLRAVTSRAHALAQRWPMGVWAGAAIAVIAIGVIVLVYSTPWGGAPDRQTRIEPSANSPTASAVPLDTRPTAETDAARGPLVFDARALVGIGDRQREREVNVQFADDNLTVIAAAFPNDVVHRLAYQAIASIAYSRSRHPLWISANGRPARAAQAGKVFGIFPRSRLWVTLEIKDAADSLIVLRLENDAQVKRVVGALEERTGVKARRIIEPKDAR